MYIRMHLCVCVCVCVCVYIYTIPSVSRPENNNNNNNNNNCKGNTGLYFPQNCPDHTGIRITRVRSTQGLPYRPHHLYASVNNVKSMKAPLSRKMPL